MGQFLSILFSGESPPSLDFNSLEAPSGDETALAAYNAAEKALQDFAPALTYLENYKGNDELVKKAMKSPKDAEVQKESFVGMFPNIIQIKGFYALSQQFNSATENLLACVLREDAFASGGGSGTGEALLNNAALVIRLADIFENVFLFDWAKMSKPSVQNDFSFYRRELNKNANMPNLPVDDTTASGISMFVAQSNPFLASLETALRPKASADSGMLKFLADFCNMCAANTKQQSDPALIKTLNLSMVVAIALFDRIDSTGAFIKSSPVDIKKAVQSLKAWSDSDLSTSALSTLQYSTKTFNKAPGGIRKLFP